MKKMQKITKNKKGINTILASLLMVVIVVVASVMVYAWSTGLLGTLLVHPTTGQENLNHVTYSRSSSNSTNMTTNNNSLLTANDITHTYYLNNYTSKTYH